MRIGKREFDTSHHTYIMGILNVTPDSFSDGGSYRETDQALYHCQRMLREGADLIDIGGESTRPGHQPVSDQEEIERVIPVIEAIRDRFDPVISLDTMKSRVAEEGIAAGVDLINDVWGLAFDERMGQVIARSGAACCLMHNNPCEDPETYYKDFPGQLTEEMARIASRAAQAGIRKDRIILDPGIGFGKTRGQDLMVMRDLGRLGKLGYPLLLGVSRKRVIGHVLDLDISQRDHATAVISAYAAMQGCAFVRVHNVKENAQAIKMVETIRDI